jgi:hypothetical protein
VRTITITIGSISIRAELFDTPTADAIYAALPFDAGANTWGDEVCFSTPVHVGLEPDDRDVVEAGELSFWIEGDSIASGFGPTPISQGDEIRLAARTNIWGQALDDVYQLKSVSSGAAIHVQAGGAQ